MGWAWSSPASAHRALARGSRALAARTLKAGSTARRPPAHARRQTGWIIRTDSVIRVDLPLVKPARADACNAFPLFYYRIPHADRSRHRSGAMAPILSRDESPRASTGRDRVENVAETRHQVHESAATSTSASPKALANPRNGRERDDRVISTGPVQGMGLNPWGLALEASARREGSGRRAQFTAKASGKLIGDMRSCNVLSIDAGS